MSTPTTYNLSEVLRALGARTAAAVPSIRTGELIGTIQLGDFSTTLAPEAIERRGVTFGVDIRARSGVSWGGFYIQSLAGGGIILEWVAHNHPGFAQKPGWFRCSEIPWAGGSFTTILPIGGGTVISRFNRISSSPWPFPNIAALSDGIITYEVPEVENVFERWWVPPGWYVGFIWVGELALGDVDTPVPNVRFREIAQGQGPP